MVEAIIFFLVSFSIFILNLVVSKNFFYPPSIFTLIWTVVIFSYLVILLINKNEVYILDTICLLIFVIGEFLFSLFGLLALLQNNVSKIKHVPISTIIKYKFDVVLFSILLFLLPIYLNAISNIVASSKLKDVNFYFALRYEYIYNDVKIGILDYINTLSVFSFAVVQYKYQFIKKGLPLGSLEKCYKFIFNFLVFGYAFLSTGRAYFLLLLSILFMYKIVAKTIQKKHFIYGILFFLLIFVANALILGKGANTDHSFLENTSSILENIFTYFLGGIYGFNNAYKQGFVYDYGENVFRFFIALANAVGLVSTKPKEVLLPYISNPIETNVYSLYYTYFKDFGFFGLTFISFFGYLHSFFYCKVQNNKNFINVFWYSILVYPLLMSFFHDQFMYTFSTWVQFTLLAIFGNFFITKKINV
jgi:oligosaccharide repeat unit polymerase